MKSKPESAAPASPRLRIAALCALLVAAAALAAAWVSDDGLVTFRTVENLAAGDGFRWNTAERTQTATHPLWVLLLALGRLAGGELFASAIVISLACTVVATWLLARLASSAWTALGVVALGLGASRTFVQFSTGGLENPLVHALLAAFAAVWFGERAGRDGMVLRRLGVLAALLLLARIDLAPLVLPCMVGAALRLPIGAAVSALLPGALLLAGWVAFATIYFGTPIPTPGYAKAIALDVPAADLAQQGLRYLADTAWRDPPLAIAMAAALFAAVLRRRAVFALPALGIALHLAYVVKVGGDFMAGRFFAASLVFAIALLARWCRDAEAVVIGVAFAIGAALAPALPPWLDVLPDRGDARMHHGIVDERTWYAKDLAMWSPERPWPEYGEFTAALWANGRTRPMVDLAHAAGLRAYVAGPRVHVVEPWICDPLLTRLPLAAPGQWRIGHFTRRIPEGYLETLATGENVLHHPALREYYETLRTVLRAPLLDRARLRALWRLWSGDVDGLLDRYVREEYRDPPLVTVPLDRFAAPVPGGTFWFDWPAAVVVREGGLRVAFGGPAAGEDSTPPQHGARVLRLSCDGSGAGRLRFCRGGDELATAPFAAAAFGAAPIAIAVPPGARGFDAVELHLDRPGDPSITVLAVLAVLGVLVE